MDLLGREVVVAVGSGCFFVEPTNTSTPPIIVSCLEWMDAWLDFGGCMRMGSRPRERDAPFLSTYDE